MLHPPNLPDTIPYVKDHYDALPQVVMRELKSDRLDMPTMSPTERDTYEMVLPIVIFLALLVVGVKLFKDERRRFRE